MATNIQHSVIAGRLTAKPELKTTAKGDFICTFTVAVNLGTGEDRFTEFNECIAFGKTAEGIARHFQKGDEIEVICAKGWRTREWTARDGSKHYKMEHRVSDFNFVGPRSAQADQEPASAAETPPAPQFTAPMPVFDDASTTDQEDLPF